VKPSDPKPLLNLDSMGDLGLEPHELHPLLVSLESALSQQLAELSASLQAQAIPEVMHRHLHTLKGLAGLMASPDLLSAITRADDAWRVRNRDLGLKLTPDLMSDLQRWQHETRAWLQRYSSD
jgi:HPt (histidine-containing phosphotransfer) domain-containing protein